MFPSILRYPNSQLYPHCVNVPHGYTLPVTVQSRVSVGEESASQEVAILRHLLLTWPHSYSIPSDRDEIEEPKSAYMVVPDFSERDHA